MFFSAPQFAMQSQMRSKRTESMNLNWFKEQRGRTKWMEMKCMVNKTALNRNWHACQPVARTQQKSGRAKESESGERERLGVVIIIIFSNSTFAISLHTAEICINYTVRPWVMILFELVALIHSLSLYLSFVCCCCCLSINSCCSSGATFAFRLYHFRLCKSNMYAFAGSF